MINLRLHVSRFVASARMINHRHSSHFVAPVNKRGARIQVGHRWARWCGWLNTGTLSRMAQGFPKLAEFWAAQRGQVLLSASVRPVAVDAETTRPTDLLTCRKLDLQKAQSLQFAGTVQPANVNGVNSTSLDSLDESRFRIRVIACH